MRASFFTALAIFAVGCSTQSTELSLRARAPAQAPREIQRPAKKMAEVATPVRVFIAPLEDSRLDSDSLGQVGARAFSALKVKDWIGESFGAQVRAECQWVSAAEESELTVRATLRKCYVSNVDVTKAAVVVVEVQYDHLGKAAGSRLYRGRCTSVNWWNSQGEITEALQTACQDCIVQIMADIRARSGLILSRRERVMGQQDPSGGAERKT